MFRINSNLKKVQNWLSDYFTVVEECLDAFALNVSRYLEHGDLTWLDDGVKKVSLKENQADDIRRQIELYLYTKSLFPELRGDILGLLESMDRIPNKAEAVITRLSLYRMIVPPEYISDFIRLIELSIQTGKSTIQAAKSLFSDFKKAIPYAQEVLLLENQSDEQEMNLVRKIYIAPIHLAEKMWLTEIGRDLSSIADRAEDTSDRIRISAAKRLI